MDMAGRFSTPILFMIFNRPDTTQLVFNEIRKVKPTHLFIAADGPRPNKAGEAERCRITREIITQVDWDCNVQTLFRDENLGCGKAVSQALTWFFGNVDEGIVLEDDCQPTEDFFPFCQQMLERYRTDLRIQSICGTNIFYENYSCPDSYFFTTESGVWGWASWANRWADYSFDLVGYDTSILDKYRRNKRKYRFLSTTLDQMKRHAIDTWDYQWLLCAVKNSRLCIIPKYNLVSNIGFGNNATHTNTRDTFLAELKTEKLEFPLKVPEGVAPDQEFDDEFTRRFHDMPTRIEKAKRKFIRAVYSSLVIAVKVKNKINFKLSALSARVRYEMYSRTCLLDSNVVIHPEANLWNGTKQRSRLKIGDRTQVRGTLLCYPNGGEIKIGSYCYIGDHSRIWSLCSVEIGNRVLVSHGVNIHDSISHALSAMERHKHEKDIFAHGHPEHVDNIPMAPIRIGDDAWIGFNATILKGVTIGRGAIVGAGTVVTHDVPDYAVVVGNPQRVVGCAGK